MENPHEGNNGGRIPCAYCTLYDQRCPRNCEYAPYFPFSCLSTFQGADGIFGKKNITKMMRHADAIIEKSVCSTSILQEAIGWSYDPQFGVFGFMRRRIWQIKLLEDHLKVINDMIQSIKDHPSTSGP